jgi:hypothetical protein
LQDDNGRAIWPTAFHLQLYDIVLRLMSGVAERMAVIMAPKGHAKSTLFSKIIPLWTVCCVNPNARGITASVNTDLAERFLISVRSELESNQRLIADWGPFRPSPALKWTQSELIIRRDSGSASPTLRAVGTGSAVQGGRTEFIVGDDIIDIENARTALQRDKTGQWIEGDLLGTLEPRGWAVFVGTAKQLDDFYHRIEKKVRAEPDCGWLFYRWSAIVDEEAHEVLWPERWSWDALMAKKAQVGTLTFNRDYRNFAVNDETSLFPMYILEPAKRRNLKFEHTSVGSGSIIGGIDYAIVEDAKHAQLTDSDYTVVQMWRLIPNSGGKRRLIWMERFRGKGMVPQQEIIVTTLRRYGHDLKVAVSESNQAQVWMSSAILKASKGTLPIYKHSTTRAKADVYEGIPSMAALFESGLIELPYADDDPYARQMVDIFIAELFGLSTEAHDDTVMAFYMSDIGVKRVSKLASWSKV